MSDELTPFKIEISDELIDDLRRRLGQTRWPESEPVDDWSQGMPLAYNQALCEYWRTEYDMQRVADKLNRYPQFTTTIDGLSIHFLHVRSPHKDAVPLLVTHGWPGSIIEFIHVIDALSDGEGQPFHLVIPSLPGYGFSGKPTTTGWDIERTANAWAALMARLGYDRYMAQGGDWGAIVTTMLGVLDSEHLIGIHLNAALANPELLLAFGDLTEEEQDALAGLTNFQQVESGYSLEQGTRPQTVGYSLADSPAGQCAWIVEKFRFWSDCDGNPENSFSRDDMLDDVMVYWINNASTSSARLYWEATAKVFSDWRETKVPVAYTVFPKEIVRLSERWARTRYPDLRYYKRLSKGGHFAAFEEPEQFIREVRAGFEAITAS